MNDMIMIEPDSRYRRDFARWCLAQNPPIQTAGSSGSLVPVELYPSVPPELLEGAYVDGFLYNRPSEQTKPVPAAEAPVVPRLGDPALNGETLPARKRRGRPAVKTGGAE